MSGIAFDKYAQKGAYHWAEYHGGLRRLNAYTRGRYDIVLQALQESKLPAGSRVLDVGCGDAALTGLLAGRCHYDVAGVDADPLALDLAGQLFRATGLKGEFRQAEGYAYPFADASFDAAVCADVIEHVDDPTAMLREIHRVLRPGGVLAITTPIRFTDRPLDPHHVQEWFVDGFTALCAEIFGAPVKAEISHPVFWYEAYNSGRFGRLGINLMTLLGLNPFLSRRTTWRCYTTQLLLLRKAGP